MTTIDLDIIVNVLGLLVLGCFIPAIRAGLKVLNHIREELQAIKISLVALETRMEDHGGRLSRLESAQ